MKDHQENLQEILLRSKTYREFLAEAFEMLRECNDKFSYAAFSRKAGFSSRSFPREVAFGTKNLSLTSASSFSAALGLRSEYRTLFFLLVELELATTDSTKAQILNNTNKMKERLLRPKVNMNGQSPQEIFQDHMWIEIYAASGSSEEGATVEQIHYRSNYNLKDIEKILKGMQEKNLIRFNPETERYYPQSTQLIFSDLKANNFFNSWYLKSCLIARKEAEKRFTAEDALFLNSVFSVKADQMTNFKKELRSLLERFIEQAENADGDQLARLNISFY